MVFVCLGTQDKPFDRLLKMVEEAIEEGAIQEEVIAQIGTTKYQGNKIKTFQFCDSEQMDQYIQEASLVITHGGTGSIIGALKAGKKVIAVSRLQKYKEHTNDHQLQIISQFTQTGYILECKDGEKLSSVISQLDSFTPAVFVSNTENVLAYLKEYIDHVLGGAKK